MWCLNQRLANCLESNNVIHDEQNGFRQGRSTVDHLNTLTSITETRKLRKLATFTAFVDFKKAYDTVSKSLLFQDLMDIGISNKCLDANIAIDKHVESAVELNGLK